MGFIANILLKDIFMRKSLIVLLYVLISTQLFSQTIEKNNELSNTVTIDNIVFDETDLMKLYDNENNTIAYFDRVDNKNFNVKNVKLYNLEKELIYTIVPFHKKNTGETTLNIKDEVNNKIGKITYKISLKGLRINYNIITDLFGNEIKYFHEQKMKGLSIILKSSIESNGQQIIYFKETISMKGTKSSKYFVDSEFLEENQYKTSLYIMTIFLFDEVQTEISKRN